MSVLARLGPVARALLPARWRFYSQCGEDRVLRALFPERTGFYVDVGAYDPSLWSNTRHFYDRGWSGINVEPSPVRFPFVVEGRPRDVNLNVGIGTQAGVSEFFEMFPSSLSTFDADEAVRCASFEGHRVERTHHVRVVPLREVLDEHAAGRRIDFLSVDTEGSEARVLRSNDWDRHRPVVVVVEYRRYHPEGTSSVSTPDWEPILIGAGYTQIYRTLLNAFYLRREDADLARRLPQRPDRYDP